MRFCGCAAASRCWPASSCSARLIGLPRNFYSSGGTVVVVVVQHAAQALAALNLARVAEMSSLWADELVLQTFGDCVHCDNGRRSSEWLSATIPRRRRSRDPGGTP